MNHTAPTGRVFPDRKSFEEHRRQRDAILNPPPPKPRIDAIVVKNSGRMLAGKPRTAGELLLVMPTEPPDGFITREAAEELVTNGYCDRATPEQIEAFLAAQDPTPSEQ